MDRLSMRGKFAVLVVSIVAIFIVAMLLIRDAGSDVANSFTTFYNDNYRTTQKFDRIKEIQVDIAFNSRGLQIAYLLNLSDQIPGYLESLDKNYKATPPLLNELTRSYVGPKQTIDELNKLIGTYHSNTQAFIGAMKASPENKAPFPVFSAFITSYQELLEFMTVFKAKADANANLVQQTAKQRISASNITFYSSLFLAMLLALALGAWMSNSISSGIRRIQKAAQALAQGNLNKQLQVTGADEIADLSNSLNESATHLSGIVKNVMSSAQLVRQNSNSVLNANERIIIVVADVNEHLLQVVTAIEEMSSTARTIAENTNEAATATGEITTQAQAGHVSSLQSVEAIQGLYKSLSDTSDVIGQLRKETTNIEQILNVIRGISEQTNLLALNAAIEAARAGEQGRGFAVVADEVRALAQKSQDSVNEIESMLTTLNTVGETAVARMLDSRELAEDVRVKVDDNNHIIQKILEQAKQSSGQTQQIATAAEEQSTVAADISKNVHNIQHLTNKSADIVNSTNEDSRLMLETSETMSQNLKFFKLDQ